MEKHRRDSGHIGKLNMTSQMAMAILLRGLTKENI
jgi:hypothetical protein